MFSKLLNVFSSEIQQNWFFSLSLHIINQQGLALKCVIPFNFFSMNIFVAKLSYQTSEEQLEQLFQKFGEVESAKIIFDKYQGRSKGYGFVEMPNDEEALEAINSLNDTEFDGRTIVVKKAKPKED